jgi:hypothetical protein
MMQLARRALLVVVLLLASVGTASAECAWVLWEQVSSVSSVGERGSFETEYRIVEARGTEGACRALVSQAAKGRAAQWGDRATLSNENSSVSVAGEKTAVSWDYRCLPDTVDPRGPKGR